jgi:peroxiredoxin Q/BCP
MAKTLRVGDVAPDFELPSTQGPLRLSKELEQGAVLLVFYPGDDTPVCTRQLCDYRDHLEDFAGLGVRVVAINPQGLESHQKFAARHALPFPLASDADKRVCREYGALGLLGMAKRALFLVAQDGRVAYAKADLPIFRRSADELREAFAGLSLAKGA